MKASDEDKINEQVRTEEDENLEQVKKLFKITKHPKRFNIVNSFDMQAEPQTDQYHLSFYSFLKFRPVKEVLHMDFIK